MYLFVAILALSGIGVVYRYVQRSSGPKPSLGKSFVTRPTPVLAKRDVDARRLRNLKVSELIDITDFSTDASGTRWYEVTDRGTRGFVRARDVAPPKVADSEKGFQLLQHYLVGMEDAAHVDDARAAVDYYRKVFPASPHGDLLTWLLAEQTRLMAERTGNPARLLVSAREQYALIAQGAGSYAERARQTLAQLPVPSQSGGSNRGGVTPSPGFTVTQGSENSSYMLLTRMPGVSIRRLSILSETPLVARLGKAVPVTAGSSFQAEVAQDIRVNDEVAVPRGSPATLTITGEGRGRRAGVSSPWSLRLTGMMIRNLTYRVSGTAVLANFPNNSSLRLPSTQLPAVLPGGTYLEIRLDAPLAVANP